MEDVAIGLKASNRDRPAKTSLPTAEAFCQTYTERVYKFAQLISRDSAAAEDLAQDALERAIRSLKTFDPARGEVEGWLWRIVVNAGRDAGRIAGRHRLVFERLVEIWPLNQTIVDMGDQLVADEVVEAVRSLPPRYRAVIALRYGADLDYRSVGKAMGISEAAASMAAKRALGLLRTRLSKEVTER